MFTKRYFLPHRPHPPSLEVWVYIKVVLTSPIVDIVNQVRQGEILLIGVAVVYCESVVG